MRGKSPQVKSEDAGDESKVVPVPGPTSPALPPVADGTIQPDPVRFPSGMKALADYAHSKGLKFGVYTARGSRTCQTRPGAYAHEAVDAATYCSWGLDYLKNDMCGGEVTLPSLPQFFCLFVLCDQPFLTDRF